MKPAINPLSRPLVIFVGESDHGDMSYGSLVEKILIDAEEKGLSTKVFSEFPTQSYKAERQSEGIGLINIFQKILKILRDCWMRSLVKWVI